MLPFAFYLGPRIAAHSMAVPIYAGCRKPPPLPRIQRQAALVSSYPFDIFRASAVATFADKG